MNYCVFGAHLDISGDILEILRTASQERYDHSWIMMKIFECWNKKIANRTWSKVINALIEIGYHVLAHDIKGKVIARCSQGINTSS